MNKYWITYMLAVVFLVSCYREENITGDKAQPQYVVEDSNDPADHYIYEFYRKYHSFILYNYKETDYTWNMSGLLSVRMVEQDNRESVEEGLQYMEKVFFRYYTDGFKEHYFPFKILMADSLQVVKTGQLYEDEVATAGLSFLGIGKIRAGVNEVNPDSLIHLRGEIQATFWANFLYDNEMLQLPEAFWNISSEYYGMNLLNLDGNENSTADDIDPKEYGFWDRDRAAEISRYYCMAPGQTLDLFQFVRMITTHTAAELEALIAPYDRLKDKYHMLVNQLKEVYGVDIQAIGNDQSL